MKALIRKWLGMDARVNQLERRIAFLERNVYISKPVKCDGDLANCGATNHQEWIDGDCAKCRGASA